MFERYTERARRVIFFARYEASTYGSSTIESEHLLLGLVREDKDLTSRFMGSTADDIRAKIDEHITRKPKVSTSIDLPLTDECKRILAFTGEESERLGDRFLGTEHLLLGILRETNCLAARLLVKRGLQLERVREELARSQGDRPGAAPIDSPSSERSSIHALVDRLAEGELERAKSILNLLLSPTTPAMIGILAENFPRGVAGRMHGGRTSSARDEQGTVLVETQQFIKGHKISITERFRLSDDGMTISYSQEVVGPRPEQQYKHAVEFDVS